MDSSDIEDQDDQRSGVPEYLRTKTAGLGLVKDALERIFRVKGDSDNLGKWRIRLQRRTSLYNDVFKMW